MAAELSELVSTPVADMSRRARLFQQAQRWSKAVRWLRVGLPASAAALLGLYFISSTITVSIGGMQASVKRIELERDRLRMIEPKLEGVTDKQGEYVVTADYAEQNVKNTRFIGLDTVKANLSSPDNSWTRLTATKGNFDTEKEVLVLSGIVKTASSSGLTSDLTRAQIHMKEQRVVSNEPVLVNALNGTINAKTMELLMKDKLAIFRGDVKVHIYKRPVKKDGDKSKEVAQRK